MLNDLKLVLGSVAKKDFVPALTHFHISDGRIYGFNGVLAISTPTDLAVTATPKAVSFVKAVERIPEGAEVALHVTPSGKLSVKAGRFRAYIECHEESGDIVRVEPTGDQMPLPGDFLPILAKLSPFMGIDASRPWAMGIRLDNQSAFATNNIILIEHWLPFRFPTPFVIPAEAVKELLRIKIAPVAMQLESNAVTFHYESGAWLRTQLYNVEDWPDLTKVLNVESNAIMIPEGFFEAVERLDAFSDSENRLHIRGGILATSSHDGEGALVELDDFGGIGCHQLPQIAKLAGVATHMDFSLHPKPCPFFGDMLRGAIIGMRIVDAV